MARPGRLRSAAMLTLALGAAAMAISRAQSPPSATVASPDGAIRLTISRTPPAAGAASRLVYGVTFHDKPVIISSALGLNLEGQTVLGPNLEIVSVTPSSADETYTLPVGKSRTVHDVHNAIRVDLQEPQAPSRRLAIEARAWNDGVAFRYHVLAQDGLTDVRIANEATEFQFAKDATTYPLILRNYETPYEDDYHTLPLTGLDPRSLIALPLTIHVESVAFVAITEAHIEQYAGLYLQHAGPTATTLSARLSPHPDDAAVSVTGHAPLDSPWRVVMIADDPGRLIESNIVLDLNPPPAFTDTSWIKAGKAAWDWWSGSQADRVAFMPGMNTATMEHYIDFASKSGLEYMLIDAGWAQPLGPGPNNSNADITRAQGNIDLPGILAFARSKHVGVWLWAHWADVNRQMAQAFPLYEQWGVAGVKIDFMNRDDQEMVDYYRRVAALAAEHHLMLDFHGAFKPDGLRRTFPNVLTREGVLGAEYNKWSARDTVDHHVTIAFTRMLAGPMDYTPGGFRNTTPETFEARYQKPDVMGTRAHDLAMYVVYESPLMMVADYPEAYGGQPDFDFIKDVPTTWDETRVLNARIGDFITVARRHGRDWYVGSMAGSHEARLTIPLTFLPAGSFTAALYSDAPDAATVPTHTAITRRLVTRASTRHVTLIPGGGQAVEIRPAH